MIFIWLNENYEIRIPDQTETTHRQFEYTINHVTWFKRRGVKGGNEDNSMIWFFLLLSSSERVEGPSLSIIVAFMVNDAREMDIEGEIKWGSGVISYKRGYTGTRVEK